MDAKPMITLRWSSISAFMSCQRKYAYSYRDFLGKKAGKEGKARILGSHVHAGFEAALTASFKGEKNPQTLATLAVKGVRDYSRNNVDHNRTSDPDYQTLLDTIRTTAIAIVRYQVPQIGLGKYWRVATMGETFQLPSDDRNNGLPSVELHFDQFFVHPVTGNRYGIHGTIDAVLQNLETGSYVIFDWKTRGAMPQERLVDFDGQLKLYAAVVNSFGGKISQTCQYQIRNRAPEPAKITPKTHKLSLADTISTWDVWAESVRGLGEKPEKYREIMELKLRPEEYFTNPVYTPVTPMSTNYILRTVLDIGEAIRFAEETGNFPPMPSLKGCQFCDYQRLCSIEMFGGDLPYAINEEYEYAPEEFLEEDEE